MMSATPIEDLNMPMPNQDTRTCTNNMLTMTLWNANGCNRYTVDQTTNSLLTSSLILITETWLLSPLRLMTTWQQYHTYGIPLEGQSRGQMGISLLVNPDCPYPVTHFPSDNPYVLSCQVSTLLVHCMDSLTKRIHHRPTWLCAVTSMRDTNIFLVIQEQLLVASNCLAGSLRME
ncbi:hypothetical protein G6F49_013236 [Rhizopus delemar]|nr:hypothetical protein G6F49_013236 [Rhizopus delemar]